jgi:hypothetical protein
MPSTSVKMANVCFSSLASVNHMINMFDKGRLDFDQEVICRFSGIIVRCCRVRLLMNRSEMSSEGVGTEESIVLAILAILAAWLSAVEVFSRSLMLVTVDRLEMAGEVFLVLKLLSSNAKGACERRIMPPLMGRKLMLLLEWPWWIALMTIVKWINFPWRRSCACCLQPRL